MRCAVIMRSKNERPNMDRALEALSNQNYKNFTLYNVDSGSSDGSVELIKKYNPDDNRVVLIRPEEYVPGKVLNRMINLAHEPIIILLNADAIPQNEHWLEKLITPIVLDQADATMSRQVPRKNATFISAYDLTRAYDPKNIVKNPYFYSAVSCAFKRSLWEEQPFYTEGYSEDMFWCKECKEKGARFQYVPESIVEHSHNYSSSEWYRRNYIEGAADKKLGKNASILREGISFFREVVRDFLHAVKKGRLRVIPFNIWYRIIAHKGQYDGKKYG